MFRLHNNDLPNDLPREEMEEQLFYTFDYFYEYINNGSDYSQKQKDNIISNMYLASANLVPDIDLYFLIQDYGKIKKHFQPDFNDYTRRQCLEVIDRVVHSPEFQKYPISRMAEHCLGRVPLPRYNNSLNFAKAVGDRGGQIDYE